MEAIGNTACQHVLTSGDSCRARPLRGEKFCFTHHPSRTEARAAARRKGGLNRGGRRRPATLPFDTADARMDSAADVRKFLGRLVNGVAKGAIDPRVANSAGFLAKILIESMAESDLSARVAQLEHRHRAYS